MRDSRENSEEYADTAETTKSSEEEYADTAETTKSSEEEYGEEEDFEPRRRSPSYSPRRSPRRSPSYSPRRSPRRSPSYSPRRSPRRSPSYSPRRSPSYSPQASPRRSPLREPFVPVPETSVPQAMEELPPTSSWEPEDIVMSDVIIPNVTSSTIDSVYVAYGKLCAFGNIKLPDSVRVLMYPLGSVNCPKNFVPLVKWGKIWTNYQDVLVSLSQADLASYRDIFIFTGSVSDMVIEALDYQPAVLFQCPLAAGRVATINKGQYNYLHQLVDEVAKTGGGTIILAGCIRPCATTLQPERYNTLSRFESFSRAAINTGTRLVLPDISTGPQGFISGAKKLVVYKWLDRYLVIDPGIKAVVQQLTALTNNLIYIGQNYGRDIVVNRRQAFIRWNLEKIGPNQFRFRNLTITRIGPKDVEVQQGERRVRLTLFDNQVAIVQGRFGITIMDNIVYIVQGVSFEELLDQMYRQYPITHLPLSSIL